MSFHTPAHKNTAHPAGQIVNPIPHSANTVDFEYVNHGSVVILTPKNAAAKAWCIEQLASDVGRFGYGFAIEPRYFPNILDAIEGDGFSI